MLSNDRDVRWATRRAIRVGSPLVRVSWERSSRGQTSSARAHRSSGNDAVALNTIRAEKAGPTAIASSATSSGVAGPSPGMGVSPIIDASQRLTSETVGGRHVPRQKSR
jgi:hypothetical protein